MTRYTPLWQQLDTYNATDDRSLINTIFPMGGVSGGAVTAVTGTMTVSVAPGVVVVPLQTGQGAALCRWDVAEVVGPLAAAPGSNSRIDLIIAQVRDNVLDSGGFNDFIFTFVTGTASATPTPPATPTNAYPVAYVTVASGMANLNTATITGAMSGLAMGGYADVASTAPNASAPTITPPAGLLWVDTSTATPGSVAYTPTTAPPPTGTNSFTDAAGTVWVSRNGSAWALAENVLHARVGRNAAWPIPNAQTVVPWDTVTRDPYAMFASSVFTVPVAGLWLVTAHMAAGSMASGQYINIFLRQNGTAVVWDGHNSWGAETGAMQVAETLLCAANDTIGIGALASVTTLSTVVGTSYNHFSIDYLGTG